MHSDLLYAVTVTVVFGGTLAGLGLVLLAEWLWKRAVNSRRGRRRGDAAQE